MACAASSRDGRRRGISERAAGSGGIVNGRASRLASNKGTSSSPTVMAKKLASQGVALSQEQFHAMGRALLAPRRFAILKQVAATDGLACSKLDEHEVISAATISHHLKELHEAGLVEVERQGRCANLSLRRPGWQGDLHRLSTL